MIFKRYIYILYINIFPHKPISRSVRQVSSAPTGGRANPQRRSAESAKRPTQSRRSNKQEKKNKRYIKF